MSSQTKSSGTPQVLEEDSEDASTDLDSSLKDSIHTHKYNHIMQRIDNDYYDTMLNLGRDNKKRTDAYEKNSLFVESVRNKYDSNV